MFCIAAPLISVHMPTIPRPVAQLCQTHIHTLNKNTLSLASGRQFFRVDNFRSEFLTAWFLNTSSHHGERPSETHISQSDSISGRSSNTNYSQLSLTHVDTLDFYFVLRYFRYRKIIKLLFSQKWLHSDNMRVTIIIQYKPAPQQAKSTVEPIYF